MTAYNKRIVYLSDAQRQELFANGSITVGGETFTYDPTDIYVTPQGVNMSIGTVSTLPAGSSATAAIRGTVDNPILDLGIPKGDDGEAENGLPAGGTSGQILKKTGSADYAAGWETLNLNSLSDVQINSYGEDSILTYKAGRWVGGNPVVSYKGNIEEGTDPDGAKYIIDPGFSDPIYAQTVNGDSAAWDLWWNVYDESVYLLNRTAGSPFNPQMRRFTYNSEMGWYEEAALAQANEVTGMWTGTQAEYDAIAEKDAHKVYFIQE